MKWWALAYIALLMLAVKFGLWLSGPVVPYRDSPEVIALERHFQNLETLRAQSIIPPRPIIQYAPSAHAHINDYGNLEFSSSSTVNIAPQAREP